MINDTYLDKALETLEHIMEGDERTFHNQESEDGWYYDDICKAYKILKNVWTKQDVKKERKHKNG